MIHQCMSLFSKHCVSCEGINPVTQEQSKALLQECPNWEIRAGKLTRELKFKDYKETFGFVTKVAHLAEEQGHHPDIWFTWGKARIKLSTHAINGLSENDFIMAAKINMLL